MPVDYKPTLKVFRTIHRMKQLPRQGFIYFGFKGDETDAIAEHSFMVTWIAYLLSHHQGFDDVSLSEAVLVALIHDWGEAIAGDLGYIVKSRHPKIAKKEGKAFRSLVHQLTSKDYVKFWNEYNAKKPKNPRIRASVKFADAFDAWMQGLVTNSTWWPAWRDYNLHTYVGLKKMDEQLADDFQRISAIAEDPNVQIWLPTEGNQDTQLWPIVRFLKSIYSLKELPRHGFTIFGMTRSETDTFAGHGFTTACLAFLIAIEILGITTPQDLARIVMIALVHDLPVAITGDAAYDFQASAAPDWQEMSQEELKRLVEGLEGLPSAKDILDFHKVWIECNSREAWIVKVAAALDAWEMGVTTRSAWMHAWGDYREKTTTALEKAKIGVRVRDKLLKFLEAGYQELSAFRDESGGKAPNIEPLRLK